MDPGLLSQFPSTQFSSPFFHRVFTFHAFGRRIWFAHVQGLAKDRDFEDEDDDVWDNSLALDDDEIEDIENTPGYWTEVGQFPDFDEDAEEAARREREEASGSNKRKRQKGELMKLDSTKMAKVLKSLHQDELRASRELGQPAPVPSIPQLQKYLRLRSILGLIRANAIAPSFDEDVSDLIVDTDLDLSQLVEPLPPPPANVDTPSDLDSLFRFYNIQFRAEKDLSGFSPHVIKARCVEVLQMALRRSIAWAFDASKNYVVDFDDLIYLPVLVRGVQFPQLEYIFVDEAQDLSRMRVSLIRKSLKPDGRVLAVGDRNQSIYGWSGSLPNSLDHLPHAFGQLAQFELPITWRCPRLHVAATMELARRQNQPVVLLAKPGAERGLLEYRPGLWQMDDPNSYSIAKNLFVGGELVLARLTQPLKLLAWILGAIGIPHTSSAVNVGSRLLTFLKSKMDCKLPPFPSHDSAVSKKNLSVLRQEISATIEPSTGGRNNRQSSSPMDPAKLLVAIIDRLMGANPSNKTLKVYDLHKELLRLYPIIVPGKSPSELMDVTHLSTVHKAKGLERNRAVFIQPWDCPFFFGGIEKAQEWERVQEANLIYVALTRAKREMVLVDVNCSTLSWKYEKLARTYRENSERFRAAVQHALSSVPVELPRPVIPVNVSMAQVEEEEEEEEAGSSTMVAPKTPTKRKHATQEPTPDITPATKKVAREMPRASPKSPSSRRGGKSGARPASEDEFDDDDDMDYTSVYEFADKFLKPKSPARSPHKGKTHKGNDTKKSPRKHVRNEKNYVNSDDEEGMK